MADAIVPEAEYLQTLLLRARIQHLANLAFQNAPGRGQVAEQERQTEQSDLGHDLRHRTLAVRGDLNDTCTRRSQHLDIVAHGRGWGMVDRITGAFGIKS